MMTGLDLDVYCDDFYIQVWNHDISRDAILRLD